MAQLRGVIAIVRDKGLRRSDHDFPPRDFSTQALARKFTAEL
jgi:hypothetical protein